MCIFGFGCSCACFAHQLSPPQAGNQCFGAGSGGGLTNQLDASGGYISATSLGPQADVFSVPTPGKPKSNAKADYKAANQAYCDVR